MNRFTFYFSLYLSHQSSLADQCVSPPPVHKRTRVYPGHILNAFSWSLLSNCPLAWAVSWSIAACVVLKKLARVLILPHPAVTNECDVQWRYRVRAIRTLLNNEAHAEAEAAQVNSREMVIRHSAVRVRHVCSHLDFKVLLWWSMAVPWNLFVNVPHIKVLLKA